MPYKKGQSGNPAGRKKGASNVLSADLRAKIKSGMETRLDAFWESFDKLSDRDKVQNYVRVLDFLLPRLRSSYIEADIEGVNTETATHIITEILKQQIKDGDSIKLKGSDERAQNDT